METDPSQPNTPGKEPGSRPRKQGTKAFVNNLDSVMGMPTQGYTLSIDPPPTQPHMKQATVGGECASAVRSNSPTGLGLQRQAEQSGATARSLGTRSLGRQTQVLTLALP